MIPPPDPPSEMQSRSAVCPPNEIHWNLQTPRLTPTHTLLNPLTLSQPLHHAMRDELSTPAEQIVPLYRNVLCFIRLYLHAGSAGWLPSWKHVHHGRLRSEQAMRSRQFAVVLRS